MRRVWIACGSSLGLTLPFWFVTYAPLQDLPQHVAQVRLFAEWWNGDARYTLQPFTPYLLSYVELWALSCVVPPTLLPRVWAASTVALASLALHWLAARRSRSPGQAVFASLFLYSTSLYSGFIPFIFGLAAFCAWCVLGGLEPDTAGSKRAFGVHVALSGLLYFAHALWFLAALLCIAVAPLRPRDKVRRLLACIPLLVVGVTFYSGLADRGFVGAPRWITAPWERLSPLWFEQSALGGLKNPLEIAVFALLIGWCALGAWTAQRTQEKSDGRLVRVGLVLLALAWFLPNSAQNILLLAERWASPVAMFLVLGLSAPRWKRWTESLYVVAVALAFVALTSVEWVRVDLEEYSGLQRALAALPEKPRVLGLSFVPESQRVRGRTHMHSYAYAQVLRGGALNFSFAELAPMPVVVREHRAPEWTPNLEWRPRAVREQDFAFFDFVIVHGEPGTHRSFAASPALRPVTRGGRYRLYRVLRAEVRPQADGRRRAVDRAAD